MARSSSSQLPLPIESAFTNNGLFADHFLTHRLRELPEWESAPNLDAVFQTVRDVWQSKGAGMSDATNEPQSEDDFIKPVLSALWTRDCYQVQVTIPNSDGRGQPDYAIFTSQSARDGAESLKGQLGYWNDVAVVGDAKKWRDSLDKARKGETPGAQMARYLYQTKVRWGILTNGPIWRLYEQDKARQGGVFYEANLEVILASEDKAAFKQFWLFFGRAGFVADASGASFVEKAFKGSANYATEVGDDLKESVYDALRALMNGFFEASANGLDRQSPDDLKRVHDTALIVLYRLLFILFAEDRALLPLDNPHYQPTSMRDLQREVNEALRAKRPFLTGGNRLWASFCDLCVLIDTGLEVAGRTVVPAYNGGLFSAAKHPEIAPEEGATRRWRIGDAALANVIDLLAYRRTQWDEPGRETVDYNSLEVQHLGSIYEGLLELQPLVAPRALVEVRDAGKTVWKDAAKIANARNIGGQKPRSVGADEVYLATNKGERKATGSYYTPKYIVSYIVDNTIGPLAHAASQRVAELRPAFDAEIAQLQTARAAGDEEAGAGIARAERALLAPYLELRVLDPAMGSGHFLVGAADELSLAMATDPNLPELETMAGEEPQAFYKRLVVEHCLYGVDLNPLAVELAKLSLWLHTVSKDRALSFLDHHLRCGNSLVGARLDRDLNHEPPRLDARGRVQMTSTLYVPTAQVLADEQLSYFLDVFGRLGAIGTGDAAAERAKDALYREMDAVRQRYRAVAHLWLAPFFGVAVSADFYQCAVESLGADETQWQTLTADPSWQSAQQIAADKRFFHWHLEFPEVFLNQSGLKPEAQRGFDAVIGNPPYGLVKEPETKTYIQLNFPTQSYQVDYYTTFMENTLQLARNENQTSMIVPNTWLLNTTQADFRELITENGGLWQITNYRYPVFSDAVVDTCVFFCSNSHRQDEVTVNHFSVDGVQDVYTLNRELVAFL